MTDATVPPTSSGGKLRADSLIAYVVLAFLASAGLFYVNIMPALVAGLGDGLGFTAKNAGFVASANVYGAALGALGAVFLIGRLPWRKAQYVLLSLLILLDMVSALVTTPEVMIPLRFVHGIVGGLSVGMALAIIGRAPSPDRGFGMLLFVQFGLGGLGNMLLPPLVPQYGVWVLFASLIAFSVVPLIFLRWLPEYPPRVTPVTAATGKKPALLIPMALGLIALFLFQAANMGLGAYIIGLGRSFGLTQEVIGPAMGVSSWIAMAGAALVMVMGSKFGRLAPVLLAMVLTLAGSWVFHYSGDPMIYFLANCGTAVTWAFVVPYLFALVVDFDPSGRIAALAGFFSKMGLASGPALGAILLNETRYGLLVDAAVIGLLLSTVAFVIPAWISDRARRAAAAAPAQTSPLVEPA